MGTATWHIHRRTYMTQKGPLSHTDRSPGQLLPSPSKRLGNLQVVMSRCGTVGMYMYLTYVCPPRLLPRCHPAQRWHRTSPSPNCATLNNCLHVN
jgi:hypothetical protein